MTVAQNSVADRCRNFLPVIFAGQFGNVFLVGKKAAFDQNSGTSHICDYEELSGFCAAVKRASARDQRFLNKAGQALAFKIWRLGECAPEEGQPRSHK